MVAALLINSGTACGICGSAAGGSYLGVLPQYQKNFVGLRYQMRSFETTHPFSIIPGMSGRKSREFFQSVDLAGRYCPGRRWQILGFFQYQYLQQTINGNTTTIQGPGDPMVLAYYSLLPGKTREGKKIRHLLQLGAGLKFPLGAYKGPGESGQYNPAFQAGTGSWDKMISAIYTLRSEKAGFFTDVTAGINGSNSVDYRFGHRINASARGFYTMKRCEATWMGSAGMYSEYSLPDVQNKIEQAHTGGGLLMPAFGLDRFSENWALGVNYRIPAWQNLGEGYIKSKARLLVNVSYLF